MTTIEREAALVAIAWLSALAEIGAALGGSLPVPAVVAVALDELGDSRVPQSTLTAVH